MKKRSFHFTVALFLLFTSFLLFSSTVSAVPFLQLDISGGEYDLPTETIFATSNPFTLYALINTEGMNENELSSVLNDTYYVSFALINTSGGVVTEETNLADAWFSIGSDVYNVTEDMTFGTPPVSDVDKELPTHSIFPTYFIETSFTNPDQRAILYNSQDFTGGLVAASDGGLYYQEFLIEYSLPAEYSLHMDLYTVGVKNKKTEVTNFAPFSHDAQGGGLPPTPPPGGTDPVPEPATMLLLGVGLIGLAGVSRRSRKYLNK